MIPTIAITGATGNVGRALVGHLAAAGIAPRVLSRRADATWSSPVEHVVGDLADRDALARLFAGAERAFLFSTIDRDPAVDRGVLAAAAWAGVRHVVKLSSIGAGGDSELSAIGHAHRAREQDIAASGLGWTFLRPGFFMSNALQWRDQLRAGDTIAVPAADGPIVPISPRDIAEVASLALCDPDGHAGACYELTGAEAITAREQIAVLGRILGRSLACVDLTPEAAGAAARARGVPPVIVETLQRLWTATAAGQAAMRRSTFADVTGHAPETFEAWARAHAAAFQER
jgi:uncharacterized protein YbjT (DUF2867 family)